MKFYSEVMDLNFKSAVAYLTFKKLEKYSFINHAFSTRLGGVSQGYFKSMNLGLKSQDSKENVMENYKIFCNATNFDLTSLVLASQNHSNNIRVVTQKNKGIGIWLPHDMNDIDGLVTNQRGVTLVTLHADCVPIFAVDPVKKVIGLAHAGWRGTVKKIAIKLVDTMKNSFNSEKSDIVCCIGPYISKKCFQIGKEIFPYFEDLKLPDLQFSEDRNFPNKIFIDLGYINKSLLLEYGILRENIVVSDVCTKCNKDLLFSHRATGGKRGNLAAMLCIK